MTLPPPTPAMREALEQLIAFVDEPDFGQHPVWRLRDLRGTDLLAQARAALAAEESGREVRQRDVSAWACATFGVDQAMSLPQRAVRLLEEVIEAYQAAGADAAMAHKLIDFVFARPVGELTQELGAVGLTLLCLAQAAGISADHAEITEIARVRSKSAAHFRERNQAKNDAGFCALPPSPAAEEPR